MFSNSDKNNNVSNKTTLIEAITNTFKLTQEDTYKPIQVSTTLKACNAAVKSVNSLIAYPIPASTNELRNSFNLLNFINDDNKK